MAKKSIWPKVGSWSFIAGIVIAILVGLVSGGDMSSGTASLLGILGLIVGLLNIADEEVNLFLLAALVFLVSASAITAVTGVLPGTIAGWLTGFFTALVVFTAPAAFVVSLVALYHIAKDQ